MESHFPTSKPTTGTTNTTNTLIPRPPSLTMMVSRLAILSLVVHMVMLSQVSIMLMLLLSDYRVLLLLAIVMNCIIIGKLLLDLTRLVGLWLAASREKKRLGQVNPTENGLTVWSLKRM